MTTYFGRVKWFNIHTGYGFITKLAEKGGESVAEEDVFVHHNALQLVDPTPDGYGYRYLVQGEYVEFSVARTRQTGSPHEFFADRVTGICGGKLLCETRNQSKLVKKAFDQTVRKPAAVSSPETTENCGGTFSKPVPEPQETEQVRARIDNKRKDWQVVKKKRPNRPMLVG